jgi:hypothetical protein
VSDELEMRLRELAAALEVPAAPDFGARLVLAPRRRERRVRAARRMLALAALATLGVSGTALAVPVTRNAVLEVLGLRGARVVRVLALPPVPPGTASRLKLGQRIAIARARHAAVFTALEPPHARAAFLAGDVPGGRVSFLVGSEALSELRATSRPYFFKLIDPGTRARSVTVGGSPGVYLSGAVHQVLIGAGGSVRSEPVTLAGNVLLWQRGALTLRIEGAHSLRAALALAQSLR